MIPGKWLLLMASDIPAGNSFTYRLVSTTSTFTEMPQGKKNKKHTHNPPPTHTHTMSDFRANRPSGMLFGEVDFMQMSVSLMTKAMEDFGKCRDSQEKATSNLLHRSKDDVMTWMTCVPPGGTMFRHADDYSFTI